MATLIDERPADEDEVNTVQQEPEYQQPPEEDIPEKYKGKSTAEIVRMHQEAEKLLGRQSSEVGELRGVVDQYIKTQLDNHSSLLRQTSSTIMMQQMNSSQRGKNVNKRLIKL
jgi:DNA polymerase II large subunit